MKTINNALSATWRFIKDYWILAVILAAITVGTVGSYVAIARWECHRMQRFAAAGYPPTLSERIQCEDVGVKLILVPNETE